MAFDGIVIRAMAGELDHALAGGKVERIYQPEKEELVLFVHTRTGRKKAYLSCHSNHAGIWLTESNYTNPAQPSSVCMLLRKHLGGAWIRQIRQKDAERLIEMDFEARDEMGDTVIKRLVIEIMGKHSNIILIDLPEHRILDSLKRISIDISRARQILPGGIYEYPPRQNKIPFDRVHEKVLSSMKGDAKKILDNVQGLSPLIAREIAADPWPRLQYICTALQEHRLQPLVFLREDNQPADFHVIPIREYEGQYRALPFTTVSEAAAYYFEHRETSNRIRQKSADLTHIVSAALKKLRLKKQRLSEDLLKAERAEKYQRYGELLTANLHQCQTGDPSVTVTNYYDNSQITIPLDQRYAPAKNAQNYFKKYAKARTARKEKRIQLEETDRDICYLESVASFLEHADSVDTINSIREELTDAGFIRRRNKKGPHRKKKKAAPYAYRSSDGFRILAGHNNKENDILTFHMAGRNDLWFHTKDIPGSHVILFTEGKEPSDQTIFEAAAIAAWHSKGRDSENVPVDYTKVRYVKKPRGARPGMCIFTDNRTVFITPSCPRKDKA